MGRLRVLGGGAVAEAVLPLLWRHIVLQRQRILLMAAESAAQDLAARHGVGFRQLALTRANYAAALSACLGPSDLLLNLSLAVDSLDLLAWCQAHGVLYLDTNLEAWPARPRALHEARSAALQRTRAGACTAVIARGATPGLAPHFVKQALCALCGATVAPTRAAWAELARRFGLQVVQITEFDHHESTPAPAADEFVNTWSARGLAGELAQPVEIGWGDHEPCTAPGAREVAVAGGCVLVLGRSAAPREVLSWTPGFGEFRGNLLAHHEAITISELLTPASGSGRPTVFYAVRPCPAATSAMPALRRRSSDVPWRFRVLKGELQGGGNELGALLLGASGGYWYGSCLTLAEARTFAVDSNATSLQVAAGVLGGLVWALENPACGVVEAEDMDFRRVLEVAAPYLGRLGGIATAWRPASAADLAFGRFRARASRGRYWRSTPPEASPC